MTSLPQQQQSTSRYNYRFPHIGWETVGTAIFQSTEYQTTSLPRPSVAAASSAAASAAASQQQQQYVRMNEYVRRLIKNTRRAKEYTQKSLAAKLYIVPADLKSLENGTVPVLKHVADIVLFALDIKLSRNSGGCGGGP